MALVPVKMYFKDNSLVKVELAVARGKKLYDKRATMAARDSRREVERALVAELRKYFNCTEVEARVISGQMSNTTVFSALMDYKNRLDRKHTPHRLGYILNNHIINFSIVFNVRCPIIQKLKLREH